LPDLDDVTWKDLTEEARSLISAWAPSWTNHNVADPGITLVELFGYLTETFIYRLNRIGDANRREFLNLINGPSPSHELTDLKEAVRTTIQQMHEIHRAVTPGDFEALTLAANKELRLPQGETVARAKCLPEQNLEDQGLAAQSWYAPGHVTVVILPERNAQPTTELRRQIHMALEPARLLGTRIHVVGPEYITLGVRFTLVSEPNTIADAVRRRAVKLLENFFDPRYGGFDKRGWPFGRHVYVSELYQLLDQLDGVDYVKRTRDPLTGDEADELVVAADDADRLKWNELDELEAVMVQPFELIDARIDPAGITVM
jgi:hypothetical protein